MMPTSPDISTKRIYEPAETADGTRVLIMRLWPRGIRKDRVHLWRKELGPVKELLRDFLDKKVDWPTYTRQYLAGLERPEAQEAIAEVHALAREGRVTLLCGCADETHCHRSLLAAYLRGASPTRKGKA
jgi:uncharacterized protein YeaO (DUF488 family)